MLKRWLDYIIGVPLMRFFSIFAGKESPRAIRSILVIKLAAVGDTILLAPVLRALREKFPDAKIDWLVSGINQELARAVRGVDQIIIWPKVSLVSFLLLVLRLRRQRYDAVIDFEQWARGTALLTFLTGAPIRIGFDTPGERRARLFTRTHKKRTDQHELNEFTAVASLLSPISVPTQFEIQETDEGRAALKRLLQSIDLKPPVVVIHPGCGADGLPREWPLGNYAVVAHWLVQKWGATIVVTSGPEERHKADGFVKLLNGQAVNLGGQLSWMSTVSLVKAADLVISGNTGIMHIAAAFKRPQVALHGPTNPRLWGPLNPNAKVIQSNCSDCPCLVLGFEYHRRDPSCMARIQVEDVKSSIAALIDNKSHF